VVTGHSIAMMRLLHSNMNRRGDGVARIEANLARQEEPETRRDSIWFVGAVTSPTPWPRFVTAFVEKQLSQP